MPLDHIPLNNITRQYIDRLIEFREVEDRKIEYKQDFRTGVKDIEVCFDISAFANGIGGDILYGIPEKLEDGNKTAMPDSAKGMKDVTLEQVRQAIEPLLSARVQPRLPLIEFKEIEGDDGIIVIVRIPKSWRGPHLVRVGEGNQNFRCYVRNGGGKGDPLDVQQLRHAFLMSSSIPERLREFRNKRVASILSNEMPVQVKDKSLLVIHICLLYTSDAASALNWSNTGLANLPYPPTLGRHCFQYRKQSRFNLDGYFFNAAEQGINEEGNRAVMRDRSYVQLYRSGSIEVVNSLDGNGEEFLPVMIGLKTAEYVQGLLQKSADLDFRLPAYIMITLLRVGERRLYVNGAPPAPILGQIHPIDRDNLMLPEIFVEDAGGDMVGKLRPALDALWQAGGFSEYFEV